MQAIASLGRINMTDLDRMTHRIDRFTCLYGLVVSVIGSLIFVSDAFHIFFGVWFGCALALIGYRMIVQMAKGLRTTESAGKRQGFGNYAIRYLFYAATMIGLVYAGFPILAILAGMLCQKIALITYSFVERKG